MLSPSLGPLYKLSQQRLDYIFSVSAIKMRTPSFLFWVMLFKNKLSALWEPPFLYPSVGIYGGPDLRSEFACQS